MQFPLFLSLLPSLSPYSPIQLLSSLSSHYFFPKVVAQCLEVLLVSLQLVPVQFPATSAPHYTRATVHHRLTHPITRDGADGLQPVHGHRLGGAATPRRLRLRDHRRSCLEGLKIKAETLVAFKYTHAHLEQCRQM